MFFIQYFFYFVNISPRSIWYGIYKHLVEKDKFSPPLVETMIYFHGRAFCSVSFVTHVMTWYVEDVGLLESLVLGVVLICKYAYQIPFA